MSLAASRLFSRCFSFAYANDDAAGYDMTMYSCQYATPLPYFRCAGTLSTTLSPLSFFADAVFFSGAFFDIFAFFSLPLFRCHYLFRHA